MKNLSVYLPSARMFIAVLIVLVVVTFVLRQTAGNKVSDTVRGYVGIA